MEEKKKEVLEKTEVVMQLPTTNVESYMDEQGNKVKLVVLTDAITEMYNDIKELRKQIG